MKNRNYHLYYTGRAISGIGDALQDIAVITIIALLTNSVFVSGLVVALNSLARILCSFFAIKNKYVKDCKKILTYLNYLYALITGIFYVILILTSSRAILTVAVVSYETICSMIYTFYKIYQEMIVKEVSDSNEKISRLYATDNMIKVVVSFLSTFLLLLMSYKGFLVINAISFILSGMIVSRLNVDLSSVQTELKSDEPSHHVKENITDFYKKYESVFRIVILSAILSFFFASYNVMFQKVIRTFEIDIKYIGIFNAVYCILSIVLSYAAGYIDAKKIKKISFAVLWIGLIFSILSLSNHKWILLGYLLFLFPMVGAGYNTVAQIYFQNNTQRDDIPMLKSIYNILCGISILLSGIVTPFLLLHFSVFFAAMMLLFALSMIFLYLPKRAQNVGCKKE